jgi:hypothetical protein
MQAGITPDEQLAAQTKLALRRLASAVAVVSCRYGDMRHAMTATAVNAMSMNPPSMIVCVNRATTFHGAISTAKRFAINILHRIEFNGRSVLISGDTRLNQNVIKYGAGVDLLLHEVLAVNPAVLQNVRCPMRRGFCPGQAEARSFHPHCADGRPRIRRAVPGVDGAGYHRRDKKGVSRAA